MRIEMPRKECEAKTQKIYRNYFYCQTVVLGTLILYDGYRWATGDLDLGEFYPTALIGSSVTLLSYLAARQSADRASKKYESPSKEIDLDNKLS